MPDFAKADLSTESQDLTAYRTFLKRLTVGQIVTLPLEDGETSRRVMRALNSAAAQSDVRLARLPASNGSVRFRVLPSEKRAINMTEAAKQARVEKAKATREARRLEHADLAKMGQGDPLGDVAVSEAAPEGAGSSTASAEPTQDVLASADGQDGQAQQADAAERQTPIDEPQTSAPPRRRRQGAAAAS